MDNFNQTRLICDVIKLNESELGGNKNSVLIYIVYFKSKATLCWNPHQNWTYGSRDIAISAMFETVKYKGNWMLLLALSKNQY